MPCRVSHPGNKMKQGESRDVNQKWQLPHKRPPRVAHPAPTKPSLQVARPASPR